MVPISPFSTQLQLNFHSIIITLRASISGGLSPFCVRVKKKRLSGSKLELRGVGFTLLLLCFVQRQGVMVPISPFSAQLQLNFLLPYNCCRYEGCTVTCTFFQVDRLRVQWVWLAALCTHCIYLQSHSQISLVPGLPCSRTRTFIVRGACMITRLPPDPTLLIL